MYRYVAAGDSITFGMGASSLAEAYPARLKRMLSGASGSASMIVMARPGWTSADLADAFGDAGIPMLRVASGVTIWIGGDDLLQAGFGLLRGGGNAYVRTVLARYRYDVQAIIGTARRKGAGRIVLCTQYNPFPQSALAAGAIDELNALTLSAASAANLPAAPVHSWFAGQERALLAGFRSGRLEDALLGGPLPIHPNDAGHRVIAEGLYPILTSRR